MQSSVVISSRLWNDEEHHKPIVTPPVGSEDEQFLLVTSNGMIRALSMKNGNIVSSFSPTTTNDDGSIDCHTIKKVILVPLSKKKKNRTKLLTETTTEEEGEEDVTDVSSEDEEDEDDAENEEWVILALCHGGITILEWTLNSILTQQKKKNNILPRRHFKFDAGEQFVYDITSPSTTTSTTGIIYGFYKKINDAEVTKLFKIHLPSYQHQEESTTLSLAKCIENKTTVKNEKFPVENILKKRKSLVNPALLLEHDSPCPLTLLSSCHGDWIYVLMLNYMGFQLFCEYNGKINQTAKPTKLHQTFSFPSSEKRHLLTVAAISPNGKDIALGYDNGSIIQIKDVLTVSVNHILHQKRDSNGNDNLVEKDPFSTLVHQKWHWHPLAVRSMSYSPSGTSLFSGGEEAVLVTWNRDSSGNKPSHTLPRVTKGIITSIAINAYSNENMEVVLYGSDSTIQLIHAHDHTVRWKLQGLYVDNHDNKKKIACRHPIVRLDPHTDLLMLTGAPGIIQWFDPTSSKVVGELEVASYNRVSRKEMSDAPLPEPEVTHFEVSSSGNDMITVDTMLSENGHVGISKKVVHTNGIYSVTTALMSLTTTIKFWRRSSPDAKRKSDNKMPYELISTMPSPHGLKGSVDSLAISSDGTRACSLSHEDGTFRIWSKQGGSGNNVRSDSLSRPIPPAWECLYKVTIPSGYTKPSNEEEEDSILRKGSLVSFSSDGSVLAVVHGQDITLWDHSKALLLNTIHSHSNNSLSAIQFLPTSNDMILSVGKSSFEVLPPSGQDYLGSGKWSYQSRIDEFTLLSDEMSTLEVTLVVPLPTSKEIAVALTRKNIKKKKKKKRHFTFRCRKWKTQIHMGR
uniref:Uncharacterized protein n=1 Tax=Eucampia antarctica TaxID=49252 RepID=A0A7S2R063_9STRA|mmetsp:Transcript_11538/g.11062  ORF Transcript_11538/g.11062 Transcript_11538/m.11062 type:complete len:853 (+) Transcript_11538:48-2606(+)|eukprot:CAMPEP_0197840972 /NCGR_PEP_ID=MMETSP1437-20131217/45911_1 /TAXON_ID=49252 ORGANISM="Eucampia antarctica, Strain CCMP1452" /NCGR_SAMPLE_ID=MMETSP1437 /ASSEMBLY_ACC=CAM_ASM_001096 /LENGTH=852 /DNA_ID=CAMNT_0043450661 /DNA_START=45 /DNA_END=2603 /DNA_ORIENTATION=-